MNSAVTEAIELPVLIENENQMPYTNINPNITKRIN
jgi:hypothetical protein